MMKVALLLSLLISSVGYAKDYKMSKSEFLSRVDQGTITFERSPMMPAAQGVIDHILLGFKKEFSGFKDQMFYVAFLKSDNYTYLVFYEWYDRGCLYGVTEPKKFTNAGSDKERVQMGEQESKDYEKIDRKYCEKALGIEVPDGPLVRNSGAIKLETPKAPTKADKKK